MGYVIVNVCVWVLAGLLLAWTAIRLAGAERGTPLVQLMAFTPYVAGLAVLVTIGVAATGRRAAAGACAVAAAALVAVVAPRMIPAGRRAGTTGSGAGAITAGPLPGTTRSGAVAAGLGSDAVPAGLGFDAALPGPGPDRSGPGRVLRVMTANLLNGRADPAELVRLVKVEEVDVLALQELTVDCLAGLDEAGVGELLPHRVANPTMRWEGSAVLSRHPISDTGISTHRTGQTQTAATVALPDGRAVRVESAHPCAPQVRYTGEWRVGLAAQPAAPDGGLPRILMGDFNATLDHGPLRRLLATGYRDAAAERGAGLVPTWPFLHYRLPWVTLDHILVTDPIVVASVAVRPILGSDHRAVVAELRIPDVAAPIRASTGRPVPA
jgi:endonuclease/exonuclease/phosphatase family metal-dependent hydrolase